MGCCTPHFFCDWLVLGPWGAQLLPQGPVGMECNLDGKGGQDPMDGLGQSTEESHRSTGHLVLGSPLIRLWAYTSTPAFRKKKTPRKLKYKHKQPPKVYVWGGISKQGATQLVILDGIMTATKYGEI